MGDSQQGKQSLTLKSNVVKRESHNSNTNKVKVESKEYRKVL